METLCYINPDHSCLKPGHKQAFTIEALDQFGRRIEANNLVWSTTGGEIDPEGVFTAGQDVGNFTVSVKAEDKLGIAEVCVATAGYAPPPRPKPEKKKLLWTGDVAPQKWTNLYMKVLTKLVSTGDLKIRVSIEAPLSGEAPDQQVEETKAALRGLGLDDNVETE